MRQIRAIIAFIIAGLLLLPSLASAAAGQGLEISPPLLDLRADPGQVLKAEIRVRNVTTEPLRVSAQFEDFIAGDETGNPKILLDDKEKSPYSIKDWLTAPGSVTLAAGQSQNINVAINVPQTASPGGHYGVVRFTGTSPELEDTGVALSASIGTLVLVNVSGDVSEDAKVAELYTSHNNRRTSLFEYGPVGITVRIQNNGNVHIKPKGTIQVTNMFGKSVHVSQFNTDARNVLPSSIRKFEQTYNKRNLFGRYTVRADIVYGSDNKIASAETAFWAIPYKLIAVIVLGIALLIFLAKRYNRYIINRSSKNSGNGKTGKK